MLITVILLLSCARSSAFVALASPRRHMAPSRTASITPSMSVIDAPLLHLADDAVDADSLSATIQQFQDNHAFLISIVVAIATRYIIGEIRRQVEKPVMDKVSEKAQESLTPDTEAVPLGAWVKLPLCIALDLAGDASSLIPGLGEFADVAYAPVEAGLLFTLFKSNLLSGLGFIEEILPFTDVVPTFCIGWCLQHLWPTTPAARALGISKDDTAKPAA